MRKPPSTHVGEHAGNSDAPAIFVRFYTFSAYSYRIARPDAGPDIDSSGDSWYYMAEDIARIVLYLLDL
jgi:hypothetical protein